MRTTAVKKLPVERQHLVTDNLRLVDYILHKYFHFVNYGNHINDYEDHYQEGCIGLIYAAIAFDESKGFKFGTFASSYIIGFIKRYRRDRANSIRMPRDCFNIYAKSMDLIGQGYDMKDIPELLGISPFTLSEVVNALSMSSIDSIVLGKDDSETTIGELVADWRNEYEDCVFEESLDQSINRVLNRLKEPQRSLCEEWVYATMFGENLNQGYLAEKYKLSQSYISRVLRKFKQDLLFYLGIWL